MRKKGGQVLAISVDRPAELAGLARDQGLAFRLLSDEGREVIRAYGLVHEGGGLGGETIAVPAEILVRGDGSIAWSFVSERITQRAHPERVLEAIAEL